MDDTTQAKLLGELMIRRKAAKEGKVLTANFWNSLVWKKEYQQQMISAYALLKLYSYEAILAGINHKDVKWVYSLRMKNLIPYIKDAQQSLKAREEKALEAEEIIVGDDGVDVMTSKKTSRINNLKD